MVVGLLRATIKIPTSRSLKEKRSVVRQIKDRVLNRMNFSVAEVEYQDHHKMGEIAFVTVAADKAVILKRLQGLEEFLYSNPRYEVFDLFSETL